MATKNASAKTVNAGMLKGLVNPFESGGIRDCFAACMEKETNVTQWCKTHKKPNGDMFGLERMMWALVTTGARAKGKYGLKWTCSTRTDEKTGDVYVKVLKMQALDASTAAKHGWNVYDAKLNAWIPATDDHAQRQGYKTAKEFTAVITAKVKGEDK